MSKKETQKMLINNNHKMIDPLVVCKTSDCTLCGEKITPEVFLHVDNKIYVIYIDNQQMNFARSEEDAKNALISFANYEMNRLQNKWTESKYVLSETGSQIKIMIRKLGRLWNGNWQLNTIFSYRTLKCLTAIPLPVEIKEEKEEIKVEIKKVEIKEEDNEEESSEEEETEFIPSASVMQILAKHRAKITGTTIQEIDESDSEEEDLSMYNRKMQ